MRLKEIAARLDKILRRRLTLVECKALAGLLTTHSFTFRDGFVINGDEEPNIIGNRDAAAIVGCLHDDQTRHDANWWYHTLLATELDDDDVYHLLLGQIAGHPSVRCTR